MINKFVSRSAYPVSEEVWKEHMKYKNVPSSAEYNNPRFAWKMCYLETDDEKYGRYMVSEKYKLWRNLTMEEFYGSGTD